MAHGDHEHDHEDHRHAHGRVRAALTAIVGHSHDPGDMIDDALTADARGIRAVKVSLLLLGATAAIQLAIVAISGSVALLADTIHNFSDALTAIPLWIAFARGGRAATRRYTFGYRRAEDLAGLFVLLMIAASALLAAYESISRLVNPQPIANIPGAPPTRTILVAGSTSRPGASGYGHLVTQASRCSQCRPLTRFVGRTMVKAPGA